jgi:hypothetical protein
MATPAALSGQHAVPAKARGLSDPASRRVWLQFIAARLSKKACDARSSPLVTLVARFDKRLRS